jgi:hypothetical protein
LLLLLSVALQGFTNKVAWPCKELTNKKAFDVITPLVGVERGTARIHQQASDQQEYLT